MTKDHENSSYTDPLLDMTRMTRPVKRINRVSQDATEMNPSPDAFRPGPPKHFELIDHIEELTDQTGTEVKEPLFSDIDFTKPDYINRLEDVHRNQILPNEKYSGDWLSTPFGTFIRFCVKFLLIAGFIFGGIYFWNQGIIAFCFALIIFLLVYGVISSGMELGENSPYNSDASWAASIFSHFYFHGF
ncbi:MAG: hypothetical protein NTY09_06305 [bacterium]|nr:hypothetical protein [bacterium]